MRNRIWRRELPTRRHVVIALGLGVVLAFALSGAMAMTTYGEYRGLEIGEWDSPSAHYASGSAVPGGVISGGGIHGYWSYQRESLGKYSVYYKAVDNLAGGRPNRLLGMGTSGSAKGPAWGQDVSIAEVGKNPLTVATCRATGLPLPCFYYREYMIASPSLVPKRPRIEGGIPIYWAPAHYRVLALLPIWPNLIANVALLALLVTTLWYVGRVARSAYRQSHGRCRCGYPRSAPVCAECGEQLAAR